MDIIKWQENPANKNLYEAEISVLESGLNGDFELSSPISSDAYGRIIAVGLLKFSENQKQAIKIIFPLRYPYAHPLILPLHQGGDGAIKDEPKMFRKGNQYINGVMCLMRKDHWDKNEHNIGWLLRRSQKWLLAASSKIGFKPEDVIEEIPTIAAHQGQVLLPKDIELPTNLNSGIIILTKFKNNCYILEKNFISETPFSIDLGNEAFRWFRIKPGITLKDIYTNGDPNALINNLPQHGISPDHIFGKNIALYIQDDPNPWHFFKFPVVQNQIQVIYFISRNIEKELYHRTKDVFDEKILSQKRITIIGLGAIGSEVARSLARNGVGHFNLFDNDTFEIGNSVRHAADLFFIGENKTIVVKQLIMRSNPNISVNAYPDDVLNDTGILEQSLSKSDLCIVLTAEDNVDYMVNDVLGPLFNIPFIFARVSAGGLSGSIQIVEFGKTACLRCLSIYEADTLPVAKGSKRYEELPPEYGSCSTPAVAGSEIDTKEIALQVSRLSVQLLLENHSSTYAPRLGDQFYWHGPFGSENFNPFTWQISKLQKNENCNTCNP